eukprot:jgi/Ulvmu1/10674/UM066_0058.1
MTGHRLQEDARHGRAALYSPALDAGCEAGFLCPLPATPAQAAAASAIPRAADAQRPRRSDHAAAVTGTPPRLRGQPPQAPPAAAHAA